MAREIRSFVCGDCGAVMARWVGRCPSCAAWNTVEAQRPARGRARAAGAARGGIGGSASGIGAGNASGVRGAGAAWAGDHSAVPLGDVDPGLARPTATGMAELDRVLAGGLHAGSVTLIGGEPGIGKSTLLLQLLLRMAESATVLLVSAEESSAQVRLRAQRLGSVPAGLMVLAACDMDEAEAAVRALQPSLVVVDSIQTVADAEVAGPPGSVAQVRACAERLVRLAKEDGPPVVIVGHVTKDGDLAGPRVLEHLVDTVVSLEGDRHHALRVLRAVKHRFGTTGEIGLFEMGRAGLDAVDDPGGLLLGDRAVDAPGSSVAAALQGRRALLVELQVLLSPRQGSSAVYRHQGIDGQRLSMVQAVLRTRAGVKLEDADVFASAVGGVSVAEPAADLPLCLALVSAATDVALPADVVAFGEIGLAAEVRQVPLAEPRLAEAARLGMRHAIVPLATPDGPPGLHLHRVATVTNAVAVMSDLTGTGGRTREADHRSRDLAAPAPRGELGDSIGRWSTAALRT